MKNWIGAIVAFLLAVGGHAEANTRAQKTASVRKADRIEARGNRWAGRFERLAKQIRRRAGARAKALRPASSGDNAAIVLPATRLLSSGTLAKMPRLEPERAESQIKGLELGGAERAQAFRDLLTLKQIPEATWNEEVHKVYQEALDRYAQPGGRAWELRQLGARRAVEFLAEHGDVPTLVEELSNLRNEIVAARATSQAPPRLARRLGVGSRLFETRGSLPIDRALSREIKATWQGVVDALPKGEVRQHYARTAFDY